MVIGYLLWFYFADLLLLWRGWVGEIEDKVHLSPAEVEIWAELGKKNFELIKSWAKRLQNQATTLDCGPQMPPSHQVAKVYAFVRGWAEPEGPNTFFF